ncbi:Filamentation induced by cAMP protein Fic, partial [mine drainage metagenome]
MRIENKGVNVFQGLMVPEEIRLVGWAALSQALAVKGPVRNPACVSEKHVSGSIREEGGWRVFDKRYWPGETFGDHLSFALRNENLDMLLLKRIFDAVDAKVVEAFVKATPTGIPSRRAWFLYELMTVRTLDVR